jgi:hypothetical protein
MKMVRAKHHPCHLLQQALENDFSTKFQEKAAEKLEPFRIHRPDNS